MKLGIVGTGYVGLVTGTCFAEMGNQVVCVDLDEQKINDLKDGIVPIHEPGLDELVRSNQAAGRLQFSTELEEALVDGDVVFIAVGTPANEDGSADLSYVLSVAESIGQTMSQPILIVDKSTVPVGTADEVRRRVREELDARNLSIPFDVVSNPEFLREGNAVKDFMYPDRIVIGANGPSSIDVMKELYAPFSKQKDRLQFVGVRDAEMIKYAANTMLATKISFMNEVALMCDSYGVDVENVRLGIGSDPRIGPAFIYPGCGYGGSCFPKDVRAMINMASKAGIDQTIFGAVESRNQQQQSILVKKVVQQFGEDLSGKVFAVWGLAFKPDTDDIRYAPAMRTIDELCRRGAFIRAFDPQAMKHAQEALSDLPVEFVTDQYGATEGADALVLVTEWRQFRQPDFRRLARQLASATIFDGRNIYNPQRCKDLGLKYFGVGRSSELF